MTKTMERYWNWGLSVLVGIGMFLFWYVAYPHALSYQEQYQLFLWTGDYFIEKISLPGGFADWLGEFIVQFFYVEWLGALLLALLFVALQRVSLRLLENHGDRSLDTKWNHGPVPMILSMIPVAVVWWLMGDINVMLAWPVAVVLAMAMGWIVGRLGLLGRLGSLGRLGIIGEVVLIPIAYWLIGPMVWIYVMIRLVQVGWRHLWAAGWLVAVQLTVYAWLLPQWPLPMAMTGLSYYRIPLQYPQWSGYDKDMYELIRMDYLVRHERWDEIVKRAGAYQVKTPFWSNCVNLALSQKRLLADRMFDFYQSGEDALVMPRTRDLTSMLPSAEAFWRLGMVNSAQRYMFDTQESILNGKKSGRCTKRIAECMIVNGHYQTAKKQLDILKKSLFYSDWAKEMEAMIEAEIEADQTTPNPSYSGGETLRDDNRRSYSGGDRGVDAHPVYGKLRKMRYKNDFLYSYDEIDKMFGLLLMNNTDNKMALDYFLAQMLLNGNVQGFQQYLGAAQQYGGYRQMPLGYQDAMMCIQKQGNLPGSAYGNYVKRMMAGRRGQ